MRAAALRAGELRRACPWDRRLQCGAAQGGVRGGGYAGAAAGWHRGEPRRLCRGDRRGAVKEKGGPLLLRIEDATRREGGRYV